MRDMNIGFRERELEQKTDSSHPRGGKKENGKSKFLDYCFTNDRTNGHPYKSRDTEHAESFI